MARWDRLGTRGNVEDRRGLSGMGVGALGVAGILITVVANLLFGGNVDLNSVLNGLESAQTQQTGLQPEEFRGEDDYELFASTVLGSTDSVWQQIFESSGKAYEAPKLVLFRDGTRSGCGFASSSVGPHYCPTDETIYLDETFFAVLTERFGARGGDVAEAYVIAHEVGHHVQHQLGLLEQAQRSNTASIRAELQADCFAGVWAYSIKDQNIFERGEFEEAIDAAEAVGDDRIQQSIEGRINPESWTHGSSEDRKYWLGVGFESGDPQQCTPS